MAGVSRDSPESARGWAKRLHLPYPLLTDADGEAGRQFGVVRKLGIAGWTIEFFRRSTFLLDFHGVVAAVWEKVRIRGHALEVLEVAKTLARPGGGRATPPSP